MSPMAFKILLKAVLEVESASTFDPTTCYLVDYNLQYFLVIISASTSEELH